MRRISRVRSMASLSLALPALARCERPSGASRRLSRDQPGRLAQGPEETHAARGRRAGVVTILCHPLRCAPLVGERCPAAADKAGAEKWQVQDSAALAFALAALRGRPIVAGWGRRAFAHALIAHAGEEHDLSRRAFGRARRRGRLPPLRKKDHVSHLTPRRTVPNWRV